MGHMKNLHIRLMNGGDDAVAAAEEMSGCSMQHFLDQMEVGESARIVKKQRSVTIEFTWPVEEGQMRETFEIASDAISHMLYDAFSYALRQHVENKAKQKSVLTPPT